MNSWWIRSGLVMLVFTELLMLPFTLMAGWWIALMIPVVIVITGAATWAFDRAVRWVDDAD